MTRDQETRAHADLRALLTPAEDAHVAAIERAQAGLCSHGGHGWDGDTCSDIPEPEPEPVRTCDYRLAGEPEPCGMTIEYVTSDAGGWWVHVYRRVESHHAAVTTGQPQPPERAPDWPCVDY